MPLSEAQLQMRRTGIGASEAAAVAKQHPFLRRIDVFASKMGFGIEHSHHLERGIFLEPGVIQWAASRFGWRVEFPGTLRHGDNPISLATPDGIIDGRAALEVKCPADSRMWKDDDGDWYVPFYHEVQVQQAMAVTGLREGWVVALLGDNIQRFHIDYDPGLADAVLRSNALFWARHVVPQVEPPCDGSSSWDQWMQNKHPKVHQALLEDSSAEMVALVAQLRDAKERAEAEEAEYQRVRQIVSDRIGDREGLQCMLDGQRWRMLRREETPSPKVDWKAVALAAGASTELVARHTTQAAARRVFRLQPPRKKK